MFHKGDYALRRHKHYMCCKQYSDTTYFPPFDKNDSLKYIKSKNVSKLSELNVILSSVTPIKPFEFDKFLV